MTTKVSFTNNGLKILFSGLRSIMCLRQEIDVPYDKIVGAKLHISGVNPVGFRCPGTNFPRVIAAGTYYTQFFSPQRDFWNVISPPNAIEIHLQNHYYSRLVFDIENPTSLVNKIMRHLNLPQHHEIIENSEFIPSYNVDIAGTFTFPTAQDTYPAIILIAGSGPTDKDWNTPILPGSNGSGKLLAQKIAENGYVTFRYDKRGVGQSKLKDESIHSTWTDNINDLKNVIDFVRNQPNVDKDAIFIMGHSEGGLHALKLLESDYKTHIKGLVLLASTARSLAEITLYQLSTQLKTLYPESDVQEQIQELRKAFNCISRKKKLPAAKEVSDNPSIQKLYEMFTAVRNIKTIEEILDFEPKQVLATIDQPTLILSGGKDMQVDPVLDSNALYMHALSKNKTNVKLILVPTADHVLKYESEDKEKLTPQIALNYNSEERKLDAEVVEQTLAWLHMQNALQLEESPDEAYRSKRS